MRRSASEIVCLVRAGSSTSILPSLLEGLAPASADAGRGRHQHHLSVRGFSSKLFDSLLLSRRGSARSLPGSTGSLHSGSADQDDQHGEARQQRRGWHHGGGEAERDAGGMRYRDLEEGHPHPHHSHRAPWLRAFVLGANDGLVSTSSLLMGVGAASSDHRTVILSGVAGLVGGALSMAVGEYISVSSQRDAEAADIEQERLEQEKGPEARARELEELTLIYVDRGLPYRLAREVAVTLTEQDVVRAHARDELGIDVDSLAQPLQAAVVSAVTFSMGAGIPLLGAAFIADWKLRTVVTLASSTAGLAAFGWVSAWLGGAHRWRAAMRVLLGGWAAMGITYSIGSLFEVAI